MHKYASLRLSIIFSGLLYCSLAVAAPTNCVNKTVNDYCAPLLDLKSAINVDQAISKYGVTGDGVSVAIISSGIDYNHNAFGGSFGVRVIDGFDFGDNDSDVLDDDGFGTATASVLGANGTRPVENDDFKGVAPDVKLIALKNSRAGGSGQLFDVDKSLAWIQDNHQEKNIKIVLLDYGNSGNHADYTVCQYEEIYKSLWEQGVLLIASAGTNYRDSGSVLGLACPDASRYTISVGATYAKEHPQLGDSIMNDRVFGSGIITGFTQRATILDLVSPGGLIETADLGDTVRTLSGTNIAAAAVTGVAALLLEAMTDRGTQELFTPDTIRQILRDTATIIRDDDDENSDVTPAGLDFRRVDAVAALDAATALTLPTPTPTSTPTPTPTPEPSPTPSPTPKPGFFRLGGFIEIGEELDFEEKREKQFRRRFKMTLKHRKRKTRRISLDEEFSFFRTAKQGKYRLKPKARGFRFSPPRRIINLNEDQTDLSFTVRLRKGRRYNQ